MAENAEPTCGCRVGVSVRGLGGATIFNTTTLTIKTVSIAMKTRRKCITMIGKTTLVITTRTIKTVSLTVKNAYQNDWDNETENNDTYYTISLTLKM